MYVHNGNMVDINVPLTINGNQYPAHWFDNAELREEAGILPCAPTTPAFNELTQKAVQIAPVEINGVWTQQWEVVELTEEEVEAHRLATVPQSVTMRQARLALLNSNLLSNVDAAILTLPSPQKEKAKIEWEFSSVVVRDREFVTMLGAALGLSIPQLDDLFIYAATL